ncbi:MAG: sulfite exporter TauE/SafE family protein [Rhodospirillales bacterium]|nr:sulfite exporter TauE/SafE family protein [Rhodospirillales bacterium]MCW8953156.1 sulfite exporter TauE/SafE family protein [Rhodospirillales bacterium]MCW9002420.1 sulfite exporter TauE/SafE family protein [Rhodospirillales bacterium]
MNETADPDLLLHFDLLKGFESIHAGVLTMGFFYGLTLCSFSCLPLIGPYVFGTQDGFRGGFSTTALFVVSKVATYTMLGAFSGLIGGVLLEEINPGLMMGFSGLLIVAIGGMVWKRQRSQCRTVGMRSEKSATRWRTFRHVAGMGVASSLMPCLPLSAVLLYAATTKSFVTGGVLALLFGIGTSASPLYYIGGGAAGWFSAKIRRVIPQHRELMRKLSSSVLIIMGVKLLLMGAASLSGNQWWVSGLALLPRLS